LVLNQIEPVASAKNDSISFIVNSENAGDGDLKCYATYSNGNVAQVDVTQLDDFIYSIKIDVQNNKDQFLNLYLEYVNKK